MQRKEQLVLPEEIRKTFIEEVIFELEEWISVFQDEKKKTIPGNFQGNNMDTGIITTCI